MHETKPLGMGNYCHLGLGFFVWGLYFVWVVLNRSNKHYRSFPTRTQWNDNVTLVTLVTAFQGYREGKVSTLYRPHVIPSMQEEAIRNFSIPFEKVQ